MTGIPRSIRSSSPYRASTRRIAASLLIATWCLAALPANAQVKTHAWRFVAFLPTPRGNLAAATGPDGKIYAFGGVMDHPSESPDAILRDVEAYDPVTNTWTPRTPMTTRRLGATAATGHDGKIYLFGGSNGINGLSSTSVEAYDPATDTWTARSPMPVPGIAATGLGGTIYLFAGRQAGGPPREVEAYDPRTNSWSSRAPMPTPREGPAVTTARGGWIYVIGGQTPKGNPLKTVEAYNPVTNRWATRASLPAPRHWLVAATGKNGSIYAIGGEGAGYHAGNTVVVYSPKTNRWSPAPSMHTQRSFAAAVTGRNGTIYAIGGEGPSSKLKSVEAFIP